MISIIVLKEELLRSLENFFLHFNYCLINFFLTLWQPYLTGCKIRICILRHRKMLKYENDKRFVHGTLKIHKRTIKFSLTILQYLTTFVRSACLFQKKNEDWIIRKLIIQQEMKIQRNHLTFAFSACNRNFCVAEKPQWSSSWRCCWRFFWFSA